MEGVRVGSATQRAEGRDGASRVQSHHDGRDDGVGLHGCGAEEGDGGARECGSGA